MAPATSVDEAITNGFFIRTRYCERRASVSQLLRAKTPANLASLVGYAKNMRAVRTAVPRGTHRRNRVAVG
jgi:hypothetical protein